MRTTLDSSEVLVMLVGANGTGSVCVTRGVLLEMGERAEAKAVEMGDERRRMPSRVIVYMASTDLTYD